MDEQKKERAKKQRGGKALFWGFKGITTAEALQVRKQIELPEAVDYASLEWNAERPCKHCGALFKPRRKYTKNTKFCCSKCRVRYTIDLNTKIVRHIATLKRETGDPEQVEVYRSKTKGSRVRSHVSRKKQYIDIAVNPDTPLYPWSVDKEAIRAKSYTERGRRRREKNAAAKAALAKAMAEEEARRQKSKEMHKPFDYGQGSSQIHFQPIKPAKQTKSTQS